ncbi:MAG: hypothetical protein HY832_00955 [Candidatus Aenigmarchaeota archaeon]|nr:hypothetical protein [Candidatus Aenigmarchaeota archaeon]
MAAKTARKRAVGKNRSADQAQDTFDDRQALTGDDEFMCMRCRKDFPSRPSLKSHSKSHTDALEEMKMLEKGYVPQESKLGSGFKGKNKIIIS